MSLKPQNKTKKGDIMKKEMKETLENIGFEIVDEKDDGKEIHLKSKYYNDNLCTEDLGIQILNKIMKGYEFSGFLPPWYVMKKKESREDLIKELIKWLYKDNFSADIIGNILITIESKNRDSFKWGHFDKVIINGKSDDEILIIASVNEIIVFDVVSFFKYEIEHPCFIKNNKEIKEYIKVAKEAYNDWCEENEKTLEEELEKRVEDWAQEWDCRAYLAREFNTPIVIIEFDGDNPKAAKTEVEYQLSTVHVAEDSNGNLQVDAEEFDRFLNQNK